MKFCPSRPAAAFSTNRRNSGRVEFGAAPLAAGQLASATAAPPSTAPTSTASKVFVALRGGHGHSGECSGAK